MDGLGWDGSPGGRGYRAPYGANNIVNQVIVESSKMMKGGGSEKQGEILESPQHTNSTTIPWLQECRCQFLCGGSFQNRCTLCYHCARWLSTVGQLEQPIGLPTPFLVASRVTSLTRLAELATCLAKRINLLPCLLQFAGLRWGFTDGFSFFIFWG